MLPSLGTGVAQVGTSGSLLVTDRTSIPAYFVGHGVRVSAPDGTERGTWQVDAISGGELTLEEGATVVEGDTFHGLYRFDSVTVRGLARLWVDDLDEFGELVVEGGSSVRLRNSEDPTIVPGLVEIVAVPGSYRVSGGAGAVTDPDGIASARVVNASGGGAWAIAVAGDGSFPAVAVTGSPGDVLGIEATDAHDAPRTATVVVGTLSSNSGGPVLVGPIDVVPTGSTPYAYAVAGGPGAVSDEDLPISIVVVNVATGAATAPVEAAPDGSFNLSLAGITPIFGDELRLEATDSHPNPLTSVLALGTMPDRIPPSLDPSKVQVRVSERAFWVAGAAGAATDENDGWSVSVSWLSGEHSAAATTEPNGAFLSEPIVWPSGTAISVHVTDVGNNTLSAPLGELPANEGPPVVDTSSVYRSSAGGDYSVSGAGVCEERIIHAMPRQEDDATKAVGDPKFVAIRSEDTLFEVRLENRSTPGLGAWPASPFVGDHCRGERHYGFHPVEVDGAVGDEIWLIAEDGHPEWLATEVHIWSLPQISGNPVLSISEDNLVWTGAGFELVAPAGAITGAADPLTLEVRVWRADGDGWVEIGAASTTMTSGEAVDLALPAATAPGDLAVVSATDGNGRTTRKRLTMPAATVFGLELSPIELRVGEYVGDVVFTVSATRAPATTVSVDWQLVPGTATQGSDWTSAAGLAGTMTFSSTVLERTVTVRIVDDTTPEPEESFSFQLSNPVGAPILGSDTAVVTIVDNDDLGYREIVRSVRPHSGAMVAHNVAMSISGGVATLGEALPSDVDRGDRMETSVGRLYLHRCDDARTCEVRRPDGGVPEDAQDALVTRVEPAFTSLASAARPSNHDWSSHHPEDLLAGNVGMTILCYRGHGADMDPVWLYSWVTGPANRLRILAPTAADQVHGNQRHQGRWSHDAYRLEAPLRIGDDLETGLIQVEGLQIAVGGGPDDWLKGVYAWTNGRVEISETLVRLDGIELGSGSRVGIEAEGGGTTVVRNTMVWDVPTIAGTAESVGIRGYGYGEPSLEVLNSTVVGGRYGVQRMSGVVRVVNTLAAGASEACFDGEFTRDSLRNLATDASAPRPPAGAVGAVSVRGAISGPEADLHLACDIPSQSVAITSNSVTAVDTLFDQDARTVAWPTDANPLWVRLEFDSPRAVTGTSVLTSNCWSHDWSLEAAGTVEDLDAQSGSWRLVVPTRRLENEERAFGTVMFDEPVTARVFQLNVERLCDAFGALVNEWLLHGLNPACGAGVDLGQDPGPRVATDIDGMARAVPFDIGADQAHDLEIRIEHGPRRWFEGEGVVRARVVLTGSASIPVSVRYATVDGSAHWGEDYLPVSGILSWAPGEVEQMIEIPLIADGEIESDERFWLRLFDGAGARVRDAWNHFDISEGEGPVRVQFTSPVFEAFESDGFLRGEVEIESPVSFEVSVQVDAFSRTARISQDFVTPFDVVVIPAGETQGAFEIELIQDAEGEPTEELILELSWTTNCEHGPRAHAIGRIHDEPPLVPEIELDPRHASYWIQECGTAEIELAEGFVVTEGTFAAWAEVTTGGVTQVFEAYRPVAWDSYSWIWIASLSTTSTVTVLVAPALGEPAVGVEVEIEVVAPEFQPWGLEPEIEDGELTITLDGSTVWQRFVDSTLLLRNLTTGIDVVPDEPCDEYDVTVSIAVSGPDDLVVLEACNGEPVLGHCATHQLNPEVRR